MTVFLACFGLRKHDESDKSKDVMKTKWSMTNSFDNKLDVDKFLEE